jgi:phosphatidylserine decarboxylase
MTILEKIKITMQYLTPKHLVSRLLGVLADKPLGWFTTQTITWFIKKYHVDMTIAKYTYPQEYTTFNQFFTRELKDNARPIDQNKNSLIYPVDGTISQFGKIEGERIFQAKGHYFNLSELLAEQTNKADVFKNGLFTNIYLAPKDYHRIHMPISGTLKKMTYVPGDLFSVNPLTAENIPNLFARNERVIAWFETEAGTLAMVLVGATIVASIETVWAGTIAPPRKQVQTWSYDSQEPIHLKKGEEMGRFKLGSTVILLMESDAIDTFEETVAPGAITVLGQKMAETKH